MNKASTDNSKTKPDQKFQFREPKGDTVKIPEEVIHIVSCYLLVILSLVWCFHELPNYENFFF